MRRGRFLGAGAVNFADMFRVFGGLAWEIAILADCTDPLLTKASVTSYVGVRPVCDRRLATFS